jgi:L-lactate dehydrogenase complex protein LldE
MKQGMKSPMRITHSSGRVFSAHVVVYPSDQTCCGQPMADNGFNAEAAGTEALFVRNFSGFDYVVAPEGSCVHHVRDNFDAVEQTAAVT